MSKAVTKTAVTKPKGPGHSNRKPATNLPRPREDLERMEADYRAGVLTLREIGKLHGITHSRVAAYAKAHKWERNLTQRVQEAAAAKLAQYAERKPQREAAESETVAASAQVIADVVLEHRLHGRRARKLFLDLMAELEAHTHGDTVQDLARLVKAGAPLPDAGAVAKAVARATSLSKRIDDANNLMVGLERCIAIERAAFGEAMPGNQPPADDKPAHDPMEAVKRRFAEVLGQGAIH